MMNLSYSALAETNEIVCSQLFPSCQIIFQLILFFLYSLLLKLEAISPFPFLSTLMTLLVAKMHKIN